jgi:AGCS family alanine or glycine:cation symporter
MVSILEPFIDTIIICTITGLVILSSGVWTEKFDNQFQRSDMLIVHGVYSENNPDHVKELSAYLNGYNTSSVQPYNGTLDIVGAVATQKDFTVINARSIAEQVRFDVSAITPFNGSIKVVDGQLIDNRIIVSGKSLIHSAELTAEAFTRGFFGDAGRYIVTIGLLLFAFSTAIAWSYYGDRAMTFLLGAKSVIGYRIVYVAGFFWASFSDTTLIWNLAAVTIVVMTLPNLLGILLLRKEMKEEVNKYWQEFKR